MTTKIQRSSGNVFADLELNHAADYFMKAEMASRIIKVIDGKGLTQAKAAQLVQATQPDISNLKNGILKGFTIDRLLHFLSRLDLEVHVKITPKGKLIARRKVAAKKQIKPVAAKTRPHARSVARA